MSGSPKKDATPVAATSAKSPGLNGTIRAPGDKSISHRSLIFGAMAEGVTEISGLLEGADILSTAGAMQAFGAKVDSLGGGRWRVTGTGEQGFQSPDGDIDCGNAGTGARLIMGAAAGYPITARFTGDASLSSRPMGRVLDPLSEMGLTYKATRGKTLPATIKSDGTLSAIHYDQPHASAQVKSAILLAGVNTEGVTSVSEPTLSRDHTENMLRAFGAKVESRTKGDGQTVSITGPVRLKATPVTVPGDPSSAAFPIVAALITPGSDIIVENVMMNPTRTGLFECLTEMGAYLRADNYRKSGGEVIADIHVKYSRLHGIHVPAERAPSMIDEYPVLAVAAATASGETVMNGIGELRVKESDRIAATTALLKANGVAVEEAEDGMQVTGGPVSGGGLVKTHHDHRIAMSALILGLVADNPVHIDDASMIATSFPTFFDMMSGLGADIKPAVAPHREKTST